jgi:hypothetical protein
MESLADRVDLRRQVIDPPGVMVALLSHAAQPDGQPHDQHKKGQKGQ